MDYLIRERESAPPSTLPVVPSCLATSDDDNVEGDLDDYSDMPGLKEDTDDVISNEAEIHSMIQHPQIPATPSPTRDNVEDPLSSLYPQLYLRISPTAMVWGSPEDIALHQRMPYRYLGPDQIFRTYLVSSRFNVYNEEEHDRAWEASVTSPIEQVQYRAFIQLFRGPQARHRRAILSQLPIAPAVLTRNNAIVTTFESGVPTRGSSATSLDEPSPAVIEEEPDSDDDIPDLMDDPQVPTYDQKKARRVLQQIAQPWIRLIGDFRMPLLHEVPTEEDFSNGGILTSSNPPSVNLLSSSQSVNFIIQSIDRVQEVLPITSSVEAQRDQEPDSTILSVTVEQPSTASTPTQESASPDTPPKVSERTSVNTPTRRNNLTQPTSSNFQSNKSLIHRSKKVHWPKINTTVNRNMGVDRQINASFAWGSPHIQRRRFSGSAHETLPPLHESHVRQWLRELYPSQFNPTMDLNTNEDASLELEEIRALFRAILSGHISRQWFHNTAQKFTPPVMKSLGLLLRNQRDRFIMSYYGDVFLDYPQDEPTNRFIWRQVF